MIFANPAKLSKRGVLGMNMRNLDFVLAYNPRHLFPQVDNKLITKRLAEKAGIPVPKLYETIQFQHQIQLLPKLLENYEQFVVKPSKGSGGKGILVVLGKQSGHFIKTNGSMVSQKDLNRHVSNIVSGLYSLGGHIDTAMIEYYVNFSPIFKDISYQGVPDIRVLVFQGYPTMAMLRLPTRTSDGKANLHQGAVGVGIDIQRGTTLRGVYRNNPIENHPDTGKSFKDIPIPGWHDLLILASRCYEITGLGYMGIDIVLDSNHGPMILEMNARPGLAIQVANNSGLVPRLRKIEKMASKKLTIEQRVSFAEKNFSANFLK
ncbi:MAG: alpha-L-glutamate ligase-like protein [Candidatus Scalindua sp. AMX11]|nr:MAG: alpha-L-glutamate ligase-like protein [Candidatus Scalindua sp.]NOG85890.1 alpha-L-glutamate ligase-like protein [Planctomycetota bacterium]RZV96939.1 MAG: alpha-L-glutamate ligase-like protein [Candidatus Scalindua sp. SCAELEC01]TDE66448.1 MAG: alpha-L-glutamate ligase-like protein [Candidatus Scalindua sp. AMX11]GJQ60201.1 MAG: alpha-L-glutamate ligase-like protein [Candidatus Scalindua sp.]